MIIRALRAQRFGKFQALALEGLPQGTLALTGPNGAGKSAIAEAICFALFGRTASLPPEAAGDLICWGAGEAEVQLALTLQGTPYTVTRHLGAGGQEASLKRQETLEATGSEAVNRALEGLLGFDFKAFIHTLYLPQGMPWDPLPSETLKAVQGIDALEGVAGELRQEMDREQAAIHALEERLTDLQLELMELDYHEETAQALTKEKEARLKEIAERSRALQALTDLSERLEQALGTLEQRVHTFLATDAQTPYATWRGLVKDLQAGFRELIKVAQEAGHRGPLGSELQRLLATLDERLQSFHRLCQRTRAYRQHLAALLGEEPSPLSLVAQEEPLMRREQQLRKRLGTLRWTFLLLLLPALGAWGVWGSTLLPPDHPLSLALDQDLSLGLLGLAAALTLLDGALYVRASRLAADLQRVRHRLEDMAARIENAWKEAHLLDKSCDLPLPQVVEALGQIMDEGVSRALAEFIHGYRNPLLEEGLLEPFKETFGKAMKACEEEVAGIEDDLLLQVEQNQQAIAQAKEAIERLEQALREEAERRRAFQDLQARIDEGRQAIAAREQHILERQAALELLAETCARIQEQFREDLAAFSGELAARLSEGRYTHMKIDTAYRPLVFSEKRRDFIPLARLSLGDRTLVNLALRLGLAQAQVETAPEDAYPLILDHPFAFLDAHHTQRVLEALPEVSPAFPQRLVMAPELPDSPLALHLQMTRDQTTLHWQGD